MGRQKEQQPPSPAPGMEVRGDGGRLEGPTWQVNTHFERVKAP